jgi:hypothetical protein
MRKKIKTWLMRYGPAEAGGIVMAFTGSVVAHACTHNPVILAYAASLGDNTGFYGVIIFRDSLSARKHRQKANKTYSARDFFSMLKHLILEFGGAEILDSLFVRPFCMYIFPYLLQNAPLGIATGKIAADTFFYGTIILSFELKKFFSK